MTVIYITENNCSQYAVTFKNNGYIQVQRFEDISEIDKNIIYSILPMEIFLGKSKVCEMTSHSGAYDKLCHDGNTILVKVDIQNEKNNYVHIDGSMIVSFLTNDNIYKCISNMGNNLSPYSVAIGCENIYYLAPFFRIIKRENIDIDNIDKLFDIDYDDITSHEKIKINIIHSNYDHDCDILT